MVGHADGVPRPDPSEVSEWAWVDLRKLRQELAARPSNYTPWFPIGLSLLSFERDMDH
jgi:isopentenyl-diphosphate delta-isomerase